MPKQMRQVLSVIGYLASARDQTGSGCAVLLGQAIEFFVPTVGLSCLLPQLIGAALDLIFGRFGHGGLL
jgi:hypothetical protein